MSEVSYHETFKTIIEVCKVSMVNFVMMCTANVDMAMKTLFNNRKIAKSSSYADRAYVDLTKGERKLVEEMAEEIFLSTRFLSFSSSKLNGASKQEQLNNDLVKGEEKYPRTISNTISFLQHHSLRNRVAYIPSGNGTRLEATFTQNGEEE